MRAGWAAQILIQRREKRGLIDQLIAVFGIGPERMNVCVDHLAQLNSFRSKRCHVQLMLPESSGSSCRRNRNHILRDHCRDFICGYRVSGHSGDERAVIGGARRAVERAQEEQQLLLVAGNIVVLDDKCSV